ncbi:hypothetical protein L6V77_19100 [Myxococcota bacterium]|nr:hypothetical protein [Myxococcota bacterium]
MGSVSIRFRLGFAFTGFIAACGGDGGGGSGAVADAATGGDAAAGGSGGSGGSGGRQEDAAAGGEPKPADAGPGGIADLGGGGGGGACGSACDAGPTDGGAAGEGGTGGRGGADGATGGGGGTPAPDLGVPPTPCASDEACPPGRYCGSDGLCEVGCRSADDVCPPDALGRTRSCDPATHLCLPNVPCCAGVGVCGLVREDLCGGVALQGSVTCDANPCGIDCLSDLDCGAGQFCHPVDFRCTRGCRLGDPAGCPFDETCVPETRACGVVDCEAHDDCQDPAQYCDFIGALATRTCREGCRDDASCGGGGRCAADHTCVFLCDPENDRCPGGQVCDAISGRCVPLCESNDDCPADQICDAFSARCQDGCRDDAFEPDDLLDEARALDLGPPDADGRRVAQAVGRMCDLNPDVFTFELPAGARFRARLDFEVSEAGGMSGTYIAITTADGTSTGEIPFDASPAELTFPALGVAVEPGPVYVTVLAESATGSDYTLTIELAPDAEACFADPVDPADDSLRTATRLARETGTVGGTLCAGDEDWFVLRLGRNDGLALSALAFSGSAPLRLELYRASRVDGLPGIAPDHASGPGIEGFDGTAYEVVVPTDTAGFSDEDWYVRLRTDVAGQQAEYRLQYDHDVSGVVCDDDGHTEPNDEPGTAVDLDLLPDISAGGRLVPDALHGVPLDLALCPGDVDTFCLIADRDDALSATLTTASGAGLRWLDGFGDPLTALIPGQPPGAAPVPQQLGRVAGGRYCLQVAGGGGPYTLSVRRDVPAMFACAADVAETDPATGRRNDTAATATLAPPEGAAPERFAIGDGYFCDVGETADEDWYAYTPAPAGARLCVTVSGFADAGGDVDLEIYLPGVDEEALPCEDDDACFEGERCVEGACLLPYATAATRTANEMWYRGRFQPAPGSGAEYYRLVRGLPPGEGVPYRIDVSNVPDAENCGQDGPERTGQNDTPETGTALGPREIGLCDAWICPNERVTGDFYDVTVPAGADRTVFVDFDDVNEGRIYLYGTGPQPDPADGLSGFVRSELALGGQQCINLRGGARDQVFSIQVTADRMFASRVDYALRVVETDLDRRPAGDCVELGGPNLPTCPLRSEWPNFEGIGRLQPEGCYATLDAP